MERDEIDRAPEQVRRILQAAAESAAQIRGQAAEDAARIERELGGLLAELRASAERLTAVVARLQQDLAPPAAAEAAPAGDGDEAGARLTALNMALGGTPREETARYLAEHYSLADPEALLDDVYDRAGG